MSIIISKHGHRLDNFIFASNEEDLLSIGHITGGHAVLMYEGKLIVCYNKYRSNWELPGGGKEIDESLLDCVEREIFEEIGQKVDKLALKGISSVYIPRMQKSILWAAFYGEVNEIFEFVENEEMAKMTLWDMKSDIGDIDEVDYRIVKMILDN